MTKSPIAIAVEPLRALSMEEAGQFAEKMAKWIEKKLEAHGWDMNKAYPSPNGGMSRTQYLTMKGERDTAMQVVTWTSPSRRRGDPFIVKMDRVLIARFVEASKNEASVQFDAFIKKMENKCKGVVSAEMVFGDDVWSYSIISVEYPDERKENWKTQRIVNVSKYGKLFNQWPTREMK